MEETKVGRIGNYRGEDIENGRKTTAWEEEENQRMGS